MKRLAHVALVTALLVGCSVGSDVMTDAASEAPAASDGADASADTESSTSAAPAADFDPQGPSSLGGAAEALESVDVRDVLVETTSYAVALDPGTPWEIPLVVTVPAGWSFDQARSTWLNGPSSIEISAGCAGECEIKDWRTALEADGGYFAVGKLAFPAGASSGFADSASDRGAIDGIYATLDNDQGVSLTALTGYNSGRFVGCTAVAGDDTVSLKELRRLCESIQVDWSIAESSTPEYVVTQRLTAEAQAAIADPAPGVPRQVVSLDDAGSISLALPDGATLRRDGTEIDLANAESIFTNISIDYTCDGACGVQDWATKVQEFNNSVGRLRIRLDVANDSPLEDGWILTGDRQDRHLVLVVRWNDTSDRFFACRGTVDQSDLGLVDEVIGLCLSAVPDWATVN